MSPRRSFSSLIKQRLACLIQQSSKLIISIINFLPTGICISGWWQLGASPLHSQVTLAKSGTIVKKKTRPMGIWNTWGQRGFYLGWGGVKNHLGIFQRYNRGSNKVCLTSVSTLSLHSRAFCSFIFFSKEKNVITFITFVCLFAFTGNIPIALSYW